MYIYPIGTTAACRHASMLLRRYGIGQTDHPCPEITHLLLDTPSFQPDGLLRGGTDLSSILRMVPPNITVIGGNLNAPVLSGYRKLDLLQNPFYLAKNAAITADCAIRLAGERMQKTFSESPALVIGWGRIGKALARMLQKMDCPVTVAVRKERDRAMLEALHYASIDISQIPQYLIQYALIFNTVPERILFEPIPEGCVALELASTPGIPEENVISAKGLPGVLAPISSGRLIADTILQEEAL